MESQGVELVQALTLPSSTPSEKITEDEKPWENTACLAH